MAMNLLAIAIARNSKAVSDAELLQKIKQCLNDLGLTTTYLTRADAAETYLTKADATAALKGKVDKVSDQRLMTLTEAEKLKGISAGANKVEAGPSNGTLLIDGTSTVVYELPADAVKSAIYLGIDSATGMVSVLQNN